MRVCNQICSIEILVVFFSAGEGGNPYLEIKEDFYVLYRLIKTFEGLDVLSKLRENYSGVRITASNSKS